MEAVFSLIRVNRRTGRFDFLSGNASDPKGWTASAKYGAPDELPDNPNAITESIHVEYNGGSDFSLWYCNDLPIIVGPEPGPMLTAALMLTALSGVYAYVPIVIPEGHFSGLDLMVAEMDKGRPSTYKPEPKAQEAPPTRSRIAREHPVGIAPSERDWQLEALGIDSTHVVKTERDE
jgi:hypothetical protein